MTASASDGKILGTLLFATARNELRHVLRHRELSRLATAPAKLIPMPPQRRLPASTRALATAASSTPSPTRPRLDALRADTRNLDDFLSSASAAPTPSSSETPDRVVFTKSKQCVPSAKRFADLAETDTGWVRSLQAATAELPQDCRPHLCVVQQDQERPARARPAHCVRGGTVSQYWAVLGWGQGRCDGYDHGTCPCRQEELGGS